MRSRNSPATRANAASAVNPLSMATDTRFSQPSPAATRRVASSTSRDSCPSGICVSISESRSRRIVSIAWLSRFISTAGSSARKRFGDAL